MLFKYAFLQSHKYVVYHDINSYGMPMSSHGYKLHFYVHFTLINVFSHIIIT